jgi:hypothetical protein
MASYVLAGGLPLGEGWRAIRPGRSFATRCARVAPARWRRSAAFSLAVADAAAERHDVVARAELPAKAASRRPGGSSSGAECALNEQGIVRRAGLGARVEAIMAAPGERPSELARAVTAMRAALGISRGE